VTGGGTAGMQIVWLGVPGIGEDRLEDDEMKHFEPMLDGAFQAGDFPAVTGKSAPIDQFDENCG
jgi:hypothetical protein